MDFRLIGIKDYCLAKSKLKELLNSEITEMSELCNRLEGFNLTNDEFFDFDFKSTTCTVHNSAGVIKLSNRFDIWDDKNYCLLYENVDINAVSYIS